YGQGTRPIHPSAAALQVEPAQFAERLAPEREAYWSLAHWLLTGKMGRRGSSAGPARGALLGGFEIASDRVSQRVRYAWVTERLRGGHTGRTSMRRPEGGCMNHRRSIPVAALGLMGLAGCGDGNRAPAR